MAIVQSKGLSGLSGSITFNSATTAGNKIIVVAARYGADIGTTDCTDNKGNTYTRRSQNLSIAPKTAIFESQDSPTMGATHTITVTSCECIALYEMSGMATTPFDQATSNAGGSGGSPATSGTTGTLAQANEEVFVGMTADATSTCAITPTAGENWTDNFEEENGASALVYTALHKTVSATTAVSASMAMGTNTGWACCIATFKAAGGTDWPVNTTEAVGITDTAAALLPDWKVSTAWEIRVD